MNEQFNAPSGRTRFFRSAFRILAWLFVACVVAQTFIAGMALFNDSEAWKTHTAFVHLFEFVPFFMLICSFAGGLQHRLRWLSGAMLVLVFAQYATAHIAAAGAVHPVLALLLFWLSLHTARSGGALK